MQRLALFAVALVVGLAWWWLSGSAAPDDPVPPVATAAAPDRLEDREAASLEDGVSAGVGVERDLVAGGELSFESADETGSEGAPTPDAPDHVLVLKVVDADGSPVVGAEVEAWSFGERGALHPWEGPERTTDAEGRAEFEVRGDVPVAFVGRASVAGRSSASGQRTRRPGVRTEIRLTLGGGATLVGRFLDADGAPLPGTAVMTVYGLDTGGDAESVTSESVLVDGRGWFEMPLEGIEGQVEVKAFRMGWGITDPVRTRVRAGQETEPLELRLRRSLEQRGRVVLPDGTPLAARGVKVEGEREEPLPEQRDVLFPNHVSIDDEARFVVRGLEPGLHTFVAAWRGQDLPGSKSLPIEPSATEIQLVAEVCWLELTARDADGRSVRLQTLDSTAAAEPGDARLLSTRVAQFDPPYDVIVQPGTARLYAGKDADGVVYSRIVPAGLLPGRHALDLTRDGDGFGVLEVELSGPEVPGKCRLDLSLANQGVGFSSRHTFDLVDGVPTAIWRGPPPGTYRVFPSVRRSGEGPDPLVQVVPPDGLIEVRAGETTRVTLPVEERGRLVVEPRVADAQEDDRVLCELRRVGALEWRAPLLEQAVPDEGGAVSTSYSSAMRVDHPATVVDRLVPGDYELRFTGDGFRTVTVSARVAGGQELPVELRLERVD